MKITVMLREEEEPKTIPTGPKFSASKSVASNPNKTTDTNGKDGKTGPVKRSPVRTVGLSTKVNTDGLTDSDRKKFITQRDDEKDPVEHDDIHASAPKIEHDDEKDPVEHDDIHAGTPDPSDHTEEPETDHDIPATAEDDSSSSDEPDISDPKAKSKDDPAESPDDTKDKSDNSIPHGPDQAHTDKAITDADQLKKKEQLKRMNKLLSDIDLVTTKLDVFNLHNKYAISTDLDMQKARLLRFSSNFENIDTADREIVLDTIELYISQRIIKSIEKSNEKNAIGKNKVKSEKNK